MAEIESQVAMRASAARGATRQRVRSRFYVGIAVFMLAMILVGFWPSYYGALVRGAAEAPVILHVHGAIFMGWMLLFILQTVVAARSDLRLHRSLGSFGIAYGALLWLVGLLVSFVAPVINVNSGEWSVVDAAIFLPIPFGDMVLFGAFFLAAVLNRHRPEIHKRCMVVATIAVCFAAAFRLQALGVSIPLAIAIWYVPLAICMGYDLRKTRRVHPVYWIGAVAMAIALLRLPFGNTEFWLSFGVPLFESLTA
ncbi:MAG TPA: hypothetical protein VMR74_06250 [Gammaproteobacteria bacterium]|nr:hypothetical protein [Gammaproteobacteria bacterium]